MNIPQSIIPLKPRIRRKRRNEAPAPTPPPPATVTVQSVILIDATTLVWAFSSFIAEPVPASCLQLVADDGTGGGAKVPASIEWTGENQLVVVYPDAAFDEFSTWYVVASPVGLLFVDGGGGGLIVPESGNVVS